VSFFAYPGKPSYGLQAATKVYYLAHAHEDGTGALEALAEAIAAPKEAANVAPLKLPEQVADKFDQYTIGQVVARHLPEGAIVSDEAATSGAGSALATITAAPHDQLGLTGGSIGQGLPVATGAAVAGKGRKIVCLHGDGGAMYTLQALWTQAREKLDVTTVIFANRSYAILNIELARVGASNPGPKALSMLDLHNPELDWVKLASGMGVEASRASNIRDFEGQFESAIRHTGPRLIEVVL
jgi:acetolactate synthase-1/2/3 large subunit